MSKYKLTCKNNTIERIEKFERWYLKDDIKDRNELVFLITSNFKWNKTNGISIEKEDMERILDLLFVVIEDNDAKMWLMLQIKEFLKSKEK